MALTEELAFTSITHLEKSDSGKNFGRLVGKSKTVELANAAYIRELESDSERSEESGAQERRRLERQQAM